MPQGRQTVLVGLEAQRWWRTQVSPRPYQGWPPFNAGESYGDAPTGMHRRFWCSIDIA